MSIRSRSLLLLAVLSCLSGWSQAVTIYKYRMSDGGILYSQTPGRRGVLLDVMNIPTTSAGQRALQKSAQQQLERDIVRSERMTALRGSWQQVNACSEPQAFVANDYYLARPGERTGIVGGRSRLNVGYWQRVHGAVPGTEFVLDALDPSRTDYERLK
jgi:hypothetical protein